MLPIEIRAKFDAIAVIPRSGLENNNLEYESNAFILPVDQILSKVFPQQKFVKNYLQAT